MSSEKWRPSCLGLIVLMEVTQLFKGWLIGAKNMITQTTVSLTHLYDILDKRFPIKMLLYYCRSNVFSFSKPSVQLVRAP